MFVNVDDACLKFQFLNVNEKELKNQQTCWNSSIKYYWWMVEIFGFWHKQIHCRSIKKWTQCAGFGGHVGHVNSSNGTKGWEFVCTNKVCTFKSNLIIIFLNRLICYWNYWKIFKIIFHLLQLLHQILQVIIIDENFKNIYFASTSIFGLILANYRYERKF